VACPCALVSLGWESWRGSQGTGVGLGFTGFFGFGVLGGQKNQEMGRVLSLQYVGTPCVPENPQKGNPGAFPEAFKPPASDNATTTESGLAVLRKTEHTKREVDLRLCVRAEPRNCLIVLLAIVPAFEVRIQMISKYSLLPFKCSESSKIVCSDWELK